MKKIIFSKNTWEDYTSWQNQDKKTLNKINSLIKDFQSSPFDGIGRPEPLKYDLAELWSRKIDHEHRLVHSVEKENILIHSCRYHYDNK